jgi:two-component sensor histidine kinase
MNTHVETVIYSLDHGEESGRDNSRCSGSVELRQLTVKQLVEQNQGDITVKSALDQGTRFSISFPLVA